MHETITYSDISSRLSDLGFSMHTNNANGHPQNVYTHPKHKSATIVLPCVDPGESAIAVHLAAVNSILNANRLNTIN